MIQVSSPSGFESEKLYVFKTIFKDFLGLDFRATFSQEKPEHYTISLEGWQSVIKIRDVFFSACSENWLKPESLPSLPLESWVVSLAGENTSIPVIYGQSNNANFLDCQGSVKELGIDLFGSIFFCLARYEEIFFKQQDNHGRNISGESISSRGGFLMRPIVDEYVLLLKELLQESFPRLDFKSRQYEVFLSHDVDFPYLDNRGFYIEGRSLGADLLVRKDLNLFSKRLVGLGKSGAQNHMYWNFSEIMDISEEVNLRSRFFFKAGASHEYFDFHYDVTTTAFVNLFKKIISREHEIGFHPSYETSDNWELFQKEALALRNQLERLNYEIVGGRQHYLKWVIGKTWNFWEKAGFSYDSTMAFHDKIGFRSGTSIPHSVYDVLSRRTLSLTEVPLIVMDATVDHYMNLGREEKLSEIEKVASQCKRFDGVMTLLFHNHVLVSRKEQKFYREVLEVVR